MITMYSELILSFSYFLVNFSSSICFPIILLVNEQNDIEQSISVFHICLDLIVIFYNLACLNLIKENDENSQQSSSNLCKQYIFENSNDQNRKFRTIKEFKDHLYFTLSLLSHGAFTTLTMLKAPRIFYFLCIFSWASKIVTSIKLFSFITNELSKFKSLSLNEPVIRIFKMIFIGFFHLSLLSCLWYAVACNNLITQPDLWIYPATKSKIVSSNERCPNSWVNSDLIINISSDSSRYLRSFYFMTQTLFTIGFGDIFPISNEEICFTIFCLINSALFFAALISTMMSFISNLDIITSHFRDEMDKLSTCLKLCNASIDFQAFTRNHFELLLKEQNGFLPSKILKDNNGLPNYILQTFKSQKFDRLKVVPYFSQSPDSLTSLCSERLYLKLYSSNQVIIKEKEKQRKLYLVMKGRVQLSCSDENGNNSTGNSTGNSTNISSLVAGDYFGDFNLIFGLPSHLNAKTVETTEVLVLDFKSLYEALICMQPESILKRDNSNCTLFSSSADDNDTECEDSSDEENKSLEPKKHSLLSLGRSMHLLEKSSLLSRGNRFTDRATTSSSLISSPKRHQPPSYQPTNHASEPGNLLYENQAALEATIISHHTNLEILNKTKISIRSKLDNKRFNEMMQFIIIKQNLFTVLPSHRFRLIWDFLFFSILLYDTISSPILLAIFFRDDFEEKEEKQTLIHSLTFIFVLNYVTSFLSLCDMLLRSTIFISRTLHNARALETNLEITRIEIFKSYILSYQFILTLISSVPFDHLYFSNDFKSAFFTIMIQRLLSLGLLPIYLNLIVSYLEIEIKLMIGSHHLTILYLSLASSISLIWFSSFWDILYASDSSSNDDNQSSWFVDGIYWCLTTMTTVGYGDITPSTENETKYVILVSILGPTLFATIIAAVSSYVHSVDMSTNCIDHRFKVLMAYLSNLEDENLRKSSMEYVNGYFTFLNQSRKRMSESSILEEKLPGYLLEDLNMELTIDLVRRSSIFSNCSSFFIHRIASSMQRFLYFKSSVIVDRFPPCSGMYFIKSGTISVYLTTEKNRRPKHLFKGDTFAESCLFEDLKFNSFMARSSTDSEVWFLSKINFDRVVAEFKCDALTDSNKISFSGKELMNEILSSNLYTGIDKSLDFDISLMKASIRNQSQKNKPMAAIPNLNKLLEIKKNKNTTGFFIHPTSSSLVLWNIILLGITIYNLLAIPFYACFLNDLPVSNYYLIDLIFDVLFLADFLSRSFILAYLDNEDLVTTHHKIFYNYVFQSHGQFYFHLVSSLPLELFSLTQPTLRYKVVYLLRINKLFRLYDAPEQIDLLEKTICNFDLMSLITYFNSFISFNPLIQKFKSLFFLNAKRDLNMNNNSNENNRTILGLGDSKESGSLYMRSMHLKSKRTADKSTIRSGKILPSLNSNHLESDSMSVYLSRSNSSLKYKKEPNNFDSSNDENKDTKLNSSSKIRKINFQGKKNLMRISKLILIVYIAAHIIGCLFFLLGYELYKNGSISTWVDSADIVNKCFFGIYSNKTSDDFSDCLDTSNSFDIIITQYIAALYWSTYTLTTNGYGDIVSIAENERIYNVFVFILGTLVYASIVVYLQEIISQLDVTTDLAKSRFDKIVEFLKREQVPSSLIRKTESVFQNLWHKQRNATNQEIVDFLPNDLHLNIMYTLLEPLKHEIFYINNHSSTSFLNSWISHLIPSWNLPGDELFVTNMFSSKLFILVKGEVSFQSSRSNEVVTSNRETHSHSHSQSHSSSNIVYCKLTEGVLGEPEFICSIPYACNAVATTESLVYEISSKTFKEILNLHNLSSEFKCKVDAEREKLYLSSTSFLVNKFRSNLASSKMNKMLLVNNQKTKSLILLPDSIYVYIWEMIYLTVLIYLALSVPYLICFSQYFSLSSSYFTNVFIFDCFVIAFYALDIYLRSFYFAILENGKCIITQDEIFSIYKKNSMFFDALSINPLCFILWVIYFTHSKGLFQLVLLTRITFLIRLDKFFYLYQKLIVLIENNMTKFQIPKNLIRISIALLIIIYFCHITACVYSFIGFSQENNCLEGSKCSWISYNEENFKNETHFNIYIKSLIWAFYSAITVGYGNIVPVSNLDRIFCIFVMIVGSVICDAGIAAVFGSILQAYDSKCCDLRRLFAAAKKFFCKSLVDSDSKKVLMLKLDDYLAYSSNTLENSIENEDYFLLPSVVKKEFLLLKLEQPLGVIFDTLFNKISTTSFTTESIKIGFINTLINHIELYTAIPGETIISSEIFPINSKSLSNNFYIIRKGNLSFSCNHLEIKYKLDKGSIICDSKMFPFDNLKNKPNEFLCFTKLYDKISNFQISMKSSKLTLSTSSWIMGENDRNYRLLINTIDEFPVIFESSFLSFQANNQNNLEEFSSVHSQEILWNENLSFKIPFDFKSFKLKFQLESIDNNEIDTTNTNMMSSIKEISLANILNNSIKVEIDFILDSFTLKGEFDLHFEFELLDSSSLSSIDDCQLKSFACSCPTSSSLQYQVIADDYTHLFVVKNSDLTELIKLYSDMLHDDI